MTRQQIAVFLFVSFTAVEAFAQAEKTSPPSVSLQYSGTVTQIGRGGSPDTPTKNFTLNVWNSGNGAGAKQFWLVEETGAGNWPWPEQFGQSKPNATGPQLLHLHDNTPYPLELPQTLFPFPGRLTDGKEWTDERGDWSVDGTRRIKGRDCKRVRRTFLRGRQQSAWVEAKTGIVVSAEQRVVMGRGDQFELKMELTTQRDVSADDGKKLQPVAAQLLRLQRELNRENSTRPELNEQQLTVTSSAIGMLTKTSEGTPLNNLVLGIARDLKIQQRRQVELSSLGTNLVGKSAPAFELVSVREKVIPADERKDKIVVLHFWEYASEPLEEPYGQVGYLDFLNNKRNKLGVKVYGVAVNDRLADPTQKPKALRSIRKLREFMNLSYDVAIDNGDVLNSFGDPREVGAKLPLWVVIDASGTVAHYHAGFHDVDRRSGLKKLDDVVVELIQKQRKKSAANSK